MIGLRCSITPLSTGLCCILDVPLYFLFGILSDILEWFNYSSFWFWISIIGNANTIFSDIRWSNIFSRILWSFMVPSSQTWRQCANRFAIDTDCLGCNWLLLYWCRLSSILLGKRRRNISLPMIWFDVILMFLILLLFRVLASHEIGKVIKFKIVIVDWDLWLYFIRYKCHTFYSQIF